MYGPLFASVLMTELPDELKLLISSQLVKIFGKLQKY